MKITPIQKNNFNTYSSGHMPTGVKRQNEINFAGNSVNSKLIVANTPMPFTGNSLYLIDTEVIGEYEQTIKAPTPAVSKINFQKSVVLPKKNSLQQLFEQLLQLLKLK